MKAFLIFLIITSAGFAQDLTGTYKKHYFAPQNFTKTELSQLKPSKLVFIPGILAESFVQDSGESIIEFTLLTRSYFELIMTSLEKKYDLDMQRLSTSSANIEDTKKNIKAAINDTQKPIYFVTHSLGSLALLEVLIQNKAIADKIKGVIFLQSPFYGSLVSDMYRENPYFIGNLAAAILPFFNTSKETLLYLSTEFREQYMLYFAEDIAEVSRKIPMLTFGSVSNGHPSILKAFVRIMESGCILVHKQRCISPILYRGPKDLSDGLVQISSTRIPQVPFVQLTGIDHGETILKIPHLDINHLDFMTSLFKTLLNLGESK